MQVENLLERAEHPVPNAWNTAADYAIRALQALGSAKISIAPGAVTVTALAQSERARDRLRNALEQGQPPGIAVTLDISAPRPVITPFTLRFVIDADGARFDACSAGTEAARRAILAAGRAAGADGARDCAVGLGSPTPRWADGATAAIAALARLGAGTVTLSDADIALVVPASVAPEAFDRAVGALESALPAVFSLDAQRLPPEGAEAAQAQDKARFSAWRDTDGRVTLAGRVTDARVRAAVLRLAEAHFGLDAVKVEARLDPDLPAGWPLRTLMAVDALAYLDQGRVDVRADRVAVSGVSGDPNASDKISRLMADKLGQRGVFTLDVAYDETRDPAAMAPTPARCKGWIDAILAERKITFAPGETAVDDGSEDVLDDIAEVLRECGALSMEVAGHTDSQGRLSTNMRLSRQRAEAVIAALMARGALVSNFEARGYGPEFPVADNDTAAGREANRRIEFTLIGESAEAARAEAAGDAPDADPRDESGLDIAVAPPGPDTVPPRPRPARD